MCVEGWWYGLLPLYLCVSAKCSMSLLKYDDDRIEVFSSISTALRPALVVVYLKTCSIDKCSNVHMSMG